MFTRIFVAAYPGCSWQEKKLNLFQEGFKIPLTRKGRETSSKQNCLVLIKCDSFAKKKEGIKKGNLCPREPQCRYLHTRWERRGGETLSITKALNILTWLSAFFLVNIFVTIQKHHRESQPIFFSHNNTYVRTYWSWQDAKERLRPHRQTSIWIISVRVTFDLI